MGYLSCRRLVVLLYHRRRVWPMAVMVDPETLDDHLKKHWVFIVEPPRSREIEPYIDFIISVDWEEEVSFL